MKLSTLFLAVALACIPVAGLLLILSPDLPSLTCFVLSLVAAYAAKSYQVDSE